MPHEPQLQELHREMLILLKDFHDLCMKNDIKYSLHGGTLLGAVREKGFIPWDDDMDVTMMRKEFEKFRKAFKKSDMLSFKFEYVPGQCRIYRKTVNDTFVWLDIFIYDYISENSFIRKLKMLNLIFLRAWIKTEDDMKVTKARGLYTGIKYWAIYIVHLMGLPFSDSFKQKASDKVFRSFPGSKKYIHRSNDQYIGMKIFLPRSAMKKYEMIDFEDTKLMVSSAYDLILRTSYGDDYMTPKKYDNDIESHSVIRGFLMEKKS